MPSNSSPAFFGFTPATKQCFPFAYSRHIRVWNWPVLPVTPCVMTLVSLLIRIDMCASFPRHRGDDLLRRVRHVLGADDRQPGVLQDLLADVLVRALHPHDEGHGQVRLLRC